MAAAIPAINPVFADLLVLVEESVLTSVLKMIIYYYLFKKLNRDPYTCIDSTLPVLNTCCLLSSERK